ncbi:DNA polymerase III subunit psi [Candidatus Erwinia haradaeae]|uniref:DNA polymerase III subunit psi n=1 Tax=Candidatus Erwinia haradaeae TaxID=1922217 RepID=A0A803GCN6_9GAMM|nr:DNA polymerase III subunit psi [Candidatus Erwinia haradaeae]VFP87961.1 DNA polymerase III subunit psi [Candidatus Erwinia haradaeae]
MSLDRDKILKNIGIVPYRIRHYHPFKGEIALVLPLSIRLVIVSHKFIFLHNSLLMDVLRTMNLNIQQVQTLPPYQIRMLPKNACYNKWYLGIKIPRESTGINISSSILEELNQNIEEKKALWKQIYSSQLDILKHTE